MSKKLSIIVPVYNMAAEGKLNYCLDSLVGQTIRGLYDYEILCVDDASTDDSLEILLGMYLIISFNSVYIPWHRMLEPMVMGTMLPSQTLVRRAARISASEKVSPPKYRSMNSSLVSATASIKVSRQICRFARL